MPVLVLTYADLGFLSFLLIDGYSLKKNGQTIGKKTHQNLDLRPPGQCPELYEADPAPLLSTLAFFTDRIHRVRVAAVIR